MPDLLIWQKTIDRLLWGPPLLILLVGTRAIYTLRPGFIQIRHLPLALKRLVTPDKQGRGDVSSLGALCTALSATIGMGNIVGVATAIAAGKVAAEETKRYFADKSSSL
ncbi:alanine:cation symporter family protein [Parendozoicomonas sp. Alg238-R29]|uniref:alanine:cation symporter family protein n=1 Tax=Parendozoicomonas sp. Alg238-R29 TaxID=2993446 RepID=UPI00248EE13B|nr:alanine:cation symporter family protein [Parendozoicomonas sp. Alg238-R29]